MVQGMWRARDVPNQCKPPLATSQWQSAARFLVRVSKPPAGSSAPQTPGSLPSVKATQGNTAHLEAARRQRIWRGRSSSTLFERAVCQSAHTSLAALTSGGDRLMTTQRHTSAGSSSHPA